MDSPSGVGPGVLVCGGVWMVQGWTAAGTSLVKPEPVDQGQLAVP